MSGVALAAMPVLSERAARADEPPLDRTVKVSSAPHRVTAVAKRPTTVDRVHAPAEVAPGLEKEPSRLPMAISWSITGGLVAATAVTGILTLTTSHDLTKALRRYPGDPSAIDSIRHRGLTLAAVTDALGAGAILAGAFSAYLTWRAVRETRRVTDHASATTTWRFDAGLGGVSVEATF